MYVMGTNKLIGENEMNEYKAFYGLQRSVIVYSDNELNAKVKAAKLLKANKNNVAVFLNNTNVLPIDKV